MSKELKFELKYDELLGKVMVKGLPFEARYLVVPFEGLEWSLKGKFEKFVMWHLHKQDLQNVIYYLDRFFKEKDKNIKQVLFEYSVIIFMRCFTNQTGKGREQLPFQKVFQARNKNDDPIGVYNEIKNMRNQIIAHDQLGCKIPKLGIIVRDDTEEIGGVEVCPGYIVVHYEENAYMLRELCKLALNYVEERIIEVHKEVKKYYLSLNYLEVKNYPEFVVKAPET